MDLWEKVIEQIKSDLKYNDETAIYAMLQLCPEDALTTYLPEEDE